MFNMFRFLVSLIMLMQVSIVIYYYVPSKPYWALMIGAWLMITIFMSTNIYLLWNLIKKVVDIKINVKK